MHSLKILISIVDVFIADSSSWELHEIAYDKIPDLVPRISKELTRHAKQATIDDLRFPTLLRAVKRFGQFLLARFVTVSNKYSAPMLSI